MINFILEHWDVIVSLLMVIASVVLALIKKKPVLNEMDNILLKVLDKLPEWINSAETLKGADVKKSIVLESVKKYVSNEFSVILPQSYIDFIGSKIEDILSTPQKK